MLERLDLFRRVVQRHEPIHIYQRAFIFDPLFAIEKELRRSGLGRTCCQFQNNAVSFATGISFKDYPTKPDSE
jgi:hypothetical protein